MQVTLLVKLSVKPGLADSVRAAFRPALASTKREQGCIAYDLYSIEGDPDMLYLHEIWADQATLDTHMAQPYMADMMAELTPLFEGGPDVKKLTKVDG